MPTFETDWRRFYPDADPIGWMMRHAGTRHWIRFHSLPLSKRYADTDEERRILLGRQNTLASEVLGEGSPCWLTRTFREVPEGSINHEGPLSPLAAWPKYNLEFSHRFTVDEGDDEEPSRWNVFAAPQTWAAGAFDDLLLAIADERVDHAVWMSPSSGAVFAPYDGGVDLFLPTADLAKQLRLERQDWLSIHESGL